MYKSIQKFWRNGFIKKVGLISILILIFIIVLGIGIKNDMALQKKNKIIADAFNKKQYLKQNETDKLDQLNHKYENKKWYVIGDSITHNNKYQSIVANSCKISTVVTDAIAGQGIGTMADRLTTEKLANIDLITVFGGTNNYGGNSILGSISDDKTANTFYGNIRKIIDKIQTLNPKVKIVFITPLKRGKILDQPVYPAPNKAGFKLEQYVQAIKDVCEEKSIQVIDLFNDSGINVNNLSQYTQDNLHPNQAGYELISKVIADKLENSK